MSTMLQSAAEIASAVRTGAMTARAAAQAALTRIAERDGDIGAFQVVRTEAALDDADAVDARADRATLALAGVPVAIKDNVAVAGVAMRNGSWGSDPNAQGHDHRVVQRLRAAGAVIVGVTRVPELCVFGCTDSVYGVTRNPWCRDRTPGGSSGGSAASVAAGLVPVAHGNDGMGSVRIPAACCGLVGMKPGLGVVPSGLGNGSWFDMAENGVLATTVSDAALVLSVLADRPELAELAEPGRVRVAVSVRSPAAGMPVDRTWAAAAREAGRVLGSAGHTVRQANPPYNLTLTASGLARWFAGAELDARLLADRSRLEPRVRRHAALGRLILRAGFPRAAGRAKWQARVDAFFADHDVLVTPALGQSPPRSIEWGKRGWLANVLVNARYAPFAAPWNVAGWPAICVPTGVGADGLPRAVQLVARPGGEALLLSVAAQLEALRPWARVATEYAGRG